MLDKDRGTYSPPTEDNLSYETRRTASRDQAPLTLIISGIVLVVVLLAAVLFYNSKYSSRNHVPTEVGETVGDFKDDKVTDAKVLSDADLNGAETDDSQAKFAPGSETPALRDTASETNAAPPVATPIEGPLPSQAGKTDSVDDTPVPGTPVAVAPKPATPKPAASVAAPAAVSAPVAPTGTSAVQIGAYNSPEQANAEYAKVASSYGLFVGGAGKKIEKVVTDKGTFYRTAFTGLSADKAKSFCAALKSAGRACILR